MSQRPNANSDGTSYFPLDHDPTKAHEATVSHTVHDLIASGDLFPLSPAITTTYSLIVPQLCTTCSPRSTSPTTPSRPIISGVPMGTHMSPSHTCLFVGYVKQSHFSMYTGSVHQVFHRYINGCIGAASCSQAELELFIDFANNFHPALKFT
eukprot:g26814.t1